MRHENDLANRVRQHYALTFAYRILFSEFDKPQAYETEIAPRPAARTGLCWLLTTNDLLLDQILTDSLPIGSGGVL